jgi:hypothetical protein
VAAVPLIARAVIDPEDTVIEQQWRGHLAVAVPAALRRKWRHNEAGPMPGNGSLWKRNLRHANPPRGLPPRRTKAGLL